MLSAGSVVGPRRSAIDPSDDDAGDEEREDHGELEQHDRGGGRVPECARDEHRRYDSNESADQHPEHGGGDASAKVRVATEQPRRSGGDKHEGNALDRRRHSRAREWRTRAFIDCSCAIGRGSSAATRLHVRQSATTAKSVGLMPKWRSAA